MARKTPLILIAGGTLLTVLLVLWWQADPPVPVSPAPATPPAAPRSARVEERLKLLRADWARRQPGALPAAEARGDRAVTPGARPARAAWNRPAAPPNPEAPPPAAPIGDENIKNERRRKLQVWMHPPYMDEQTDLGELENRILSDGDSERRRQAIEQLAGEEPEDALRVLAAGLAMNDADPRIRGALVAAFADFVDEFPPDMLQPALADPDPQVRFEALSVLADMDDASALTAIRSALNDPDPDVRDLARGILEMN